MESRAGPRPGHMHTQAPALYTLQNADGHLRVPQADILYFYSDKRRVVLVADGRSMPSTQADQVAKAWGIASCASTSATW